MAWPAGSGGTACGVTGARHSFTPRYSRKAAPAHVNAVKAAAEAASSAPSPASDSVIAVRSPSATPATRGSALRAPPPSDWPITSMIVGPGMASIVIAAATKASQIAGSIGVRSCPAE